MSIDCSIQKVVLSKNHLQQPKVRGLKYDLKYSQKVISAIASWGGQMYMEPPKRYT